MTEGSFPSPSSSILGSKISNTGRILRDSAFSQINEYQNRFSKVAPLYELLFKDLLVTNFKDVDAYITAKKLFGKDIITFVAIDGTEYSRPLFDMIIFYAGAYSCEGTIHFSNNQDILVRYKNRFLDKGKDLSSCVPVYVDKIPEIDQTFYDPAEGKTNIMKPISEEAILNNTNIANFLMTFSEFYLAYKLAASTQYNVVLLDRSLSNMYSSLMYDTSCRRSWYSNCSLLGYKIDDIPIDINDLTIARHNIINAELDLPPRRGDYLRYAIIFSLIKEAEAQVITRTFGRGLDFDSICQNLGIKITDERRKKRVHKFIDRSVEENLIAKDPNDRYSSTDRYNSTWSRIKKLVITIGDQIFDGAGDRFIIEKEVSGTKIKQWITTLDLSFLTLFSIYMLIEESWQNNILLIGITKDTAAHDFKNHVVPICTSNNIWPISQNITNDMSNNNNSTLSQIDLNKIPNTDRMLLQSISLFNHDKIQTPWALTEYDSAFVMAIPDFKSRSGYISGAVRNKIIPSQLFLRSFVQLQEAKQDSMLRSNVLSIDRLVYPEFDVSSKESMSEFTHDYVAEEPITLLLYKSNKTKNEIQNLVITILKSMSSPSIAEVFGHNKALYIADKVAKWHNEQFRGIVDSTSTLISCDKGLKNFVFYMNTFRERRASLESSRKLQR